MEMMRGPSTAAGCAVLAMLTLAGPALGWSKPPRHLPSGAQAPIYAADATGGFHALFARPTTGPGYQLLYAEPGATATRVDTDGSPAGGDYALAVAPTGAAFAVWCTPASSSRSPGVYAAVRQPAGNFGRPQEL